MLGRNPALKILVASYGQDLAAKHARDFRTVVEAPWCQQVFPDLRPHPQRNTESEFMTTARGLRKAVSLGGAVTGHGADILIIDDMMKADDARSVTERQRVHEFYEQTLFSRLNDKQNGAIIAIQQRLHEDDLAGYLLAKGNFTHLELKAIAEEDEEHALGGRRTYRRRKGEALFPEREPLATLEEIRKEIGSAVFSAQYQQNPVPPDGNRVRWEWFGTYDERPPRSFFQTVAQSWDTAMTAEPTSDFSVCTTWGYREGKWYLLDVYRARLDYSALKRKVIELRKQWHAERWSLRGPTPAMHSATSSATNGSDGSRLYTPRDNKETRLEVQTAKIESGMVLIPREADWLSAFKRELLAFPNGTLRRPGRQHDAVPGVEREAPRPGHVRAERRTTDGCGAADRCRAAGRPDTATELSATSLRRRPSASEPSTIAARSRRASHSRCRMCALTLLCAGLPGQGKRCCPITR